MNAHTTSVEEIELAEVGDRIAVTARGEPRHGVVTAIGGGGMLTVRWDRGGESSLIPAPGTLSVVTEQPPAPPDRKKTKAKKKPDKSKGDKKAGKKSRQG